MRFRPNTVLILTFLAAACGAPESAPEAADTWVGTITTEGNVTTVVNESGSVWGGTARLVEEASIGVESGDEEYMFGQAVYVFATDDYIYVVDYQTPAVRAYDLEGIYIRDLGREGQGPGEYTSPSVITVDESGRVFVLDSRARRFNVFSDSGESLGTWPAQNAICCDPMVPAGNGNLWARRRFRGGNLEDRPSPYALQEFGPDGEVGEIRWPQEPSFEPIEIMIETRFAGNLPVPVPFSPASMWVATPSGAIATGASDRYRFEVRRPDGSALVVERYWTPVPLLPEEADWHSRFFVAMARRETVAEDWTWNGAEMPAAKPAFSGFVPAESGEIWVRRPGTGEHLNDCIENPLQVTLAEAGQARCWRDGTIIDAFGADGRFLGEVDVPAGLQPFPAWLNVHGDRVVGVIIDESGTIMVKRYRLVLPGEEEQ